ncbi:hypothetical protein BRADI_5g03624v3 [Brachypodium distachyon]|uniref:CRIB domain-containing protein n=1 Tax=Brachypodium distachyon TaxID=15368 RepID=A0A2K2CFB0_BRADI|nr:hypothetical protein BRADI_5g03624v3 [Brachypodium distachyon]
MASSYKMKGWCLWRHRNSVVFDGAPPRIDQVLRVIRREGSAWAKVALFKGANFGFGSFVVSWWVVRIFESFKIISQIFAAKEEQGMEIGSPTDVKHVAHIGWNSSTLPPATKGGGNLLGFFPRYYGGQSSDLRQTYEKMNN